MSVGHPLNRIVSGVQTTERQNSVHGVVPVHGDKGGFSFADLTKPASGAQIVTNTSIQFAPPGGRRNSSPPPVTLRSAPTAVSPTIGSPRLVGYSQYSPISSPSATVRTSSPSAPSVRMGMGPTTPRVITGVVAAPRLTSPRVSVGRTAMSTHLDNVSRRIDQLDAASHNVEKLLVTQDDLNISKPPVGSKREDQRSAWAGGSDGGGSLLASVSSMGPSRGGSIKMAPKQNGAPSSFVPSIDASSVSGYDALEPSNIVELQRRLSTVNSQHFGPPGTLHSFTAQSSRSSSLRLPPGRPTPSPRQSAPPSFVPSQAPSSHVPAPAGAIVFPREASPHRGRFVFRVSPMQSPLQSRAPSRAASPIIVHRSIGTSPQPSARQRAPSPMGNNPVMHMMPVYPSSGHRTPVMMTPRVQVQPAASPVRGKMVWDQVPLAVPSTSASSTAAPERQSSGYAFARGSSPGTPERHHWGAPERQYSLLVAPGSPGQSFTFPDVPSFNHVAPSRSSSAIKLGIAGSGVTTQVATAGTPYAPFPPPITYAAPPMTSPRPRSPSAGSFQRSESANVRRRGSVGVTRDLPPNSPPPRHSSPPTNLERCDSIILRQRAQASRAGSSTVDSADAQERKRKKEELSATCVKLQSLLGGLNTEVGKVRTL